MTQVTSKTRDPWTTALAVVLVPLGAYFLARHAVPRLHMTADGYGEYYWSRRYWLLVHASLGIVATVSGALQFSARLRARHLRLHRVVGRTYLIAVALSALSAYVLAFTSQISASYQWGLVLGASAWLVTGAMAFAAIRARRVREHRAWMVRCYTVTFFFITFFAAYDLAQSAGWTDLATLAGPLVFGCLLVPLVAVEIVLRARGLAGGPTPRVAATR